MIGRIAQKLRWFLVGLVEEEIQTIITERIVMFYNSLVERGLISNSPNPCSPADCRTQSDRQLRPPASARQD